ncbi:MAG: bifunctional 3,4-dihydroxy-2-butanone-4-phosphate synthase/GTP cyclohydrolase II [Pseudomonadota bacterium]|jgi:3,4-dihydroxy 2-butanone 4-phosphate synthase/GTP cyclohydrolase II
MPIASTTEIVEEIRAGRMVVLVDEEDRENEGDLVMAAEFATPEAINFMAKHGRGLICLTLTEDRCRQLDLPLMVRDNRSPMGTNFTMSIEAAEGVTTGISAHDRAHTVRTAVRADASPADLVQPGHIFPLRAQPGGVLVRAGHTEAGCDLAQMAGVVPASVICEILKDDGTMARLPDLLVFAETHGLKVGTIADLIQYRSRTESLIERVGEREIETPYGPFRLVTFRDRMATATHLALVHGEPKAGDEVLVRVHEPISLIDLLDAGSATHSWNVHAAMQAVVKAGCGAIILLHRPESPDQLLERATRAGPPPRRGRMDLRDYGIGAQIIRQLGITRMRVLAQPRRMPSMTGFDLEVTGYLLPEGPVPVADIAGHPNPATR